MPEDILLFPFGGNAREALLSILAVNSVRKSWNVIGFIDDDDTIKGAECCGVKVLGGRDLFKRYPDAKVLAVPGSPDNYRERIHIIGSLGLAAQRFATIMAPSATVAPDAKVGRNTVLMHNVVISCGARVGDHCVILPNTVVSHDSEIGDYCCIGSNVSISGSVKVGPASYIGSGAGLRERISIGAGALVGLGSSVIRDVEKNTVVAGSPARIVRQAEK